MTSETILDLLAVKHSKDVFVSECKDGPSQMGGHQRMDAWAMKRSWAHPLVTAYEIKVTRSDFLRDEKWRGYLPCCNCLWFVCPPRIIQPDELPTEVGLLWTSVNGARLYIKKKTVYRDIVIAEDVFRYILMARVRITREFWNEGNGTADQWREWLATKRENRCLGHNVSRQIREMVAERIERVETENARLRKAEKGYKEVAALCEKLGIDPTWTYDIEDKLADIVGRKTRGLLRSAAQTRTEIERLERAIKALAESTKPGQPSSKQAKEAEC